MPSLMKILRGLNELISEEGVGALPSESPYSSRD
jgi:hypothetical protein